MLISLGVILRVAGAKSKPRDGPGKNRRCLTSRRRSTLLLLPPPARFCAAISRQPVESGAAPPEQRTAAVFGPLGACGVLISLADRVRIPPCGDWGTSGGGVVCWWGALAQTSGPYCSWRWSRGSSRSSPLAAPRRHSPLGSTGEGGKRRPRSCQVNTAKSGSSGRWPGSRPVAPNVGQCQGRAAAPRARLRQRAAGMPCNAGSGRGRGARRRNPLQPRCRHGNWVQSRDRRRSAPAREDSRGVGFSTQLAVREDTLKWPRRAGLLRCITQSFVAIRERLRPPRACVYRAEEA